MEWRWEWFLAGVGGLLGLGILRGLLKIVSPVAVVGVMGYGLGVLFMRGRQSKQTRLPAVAPPSQPATR